MKTLFFLLICSVAQAQESYADMQRRVQQAFGGSSEYQQQYQPQYQRQQPDQPVVCRTKRVLGTGFFGGDPQYETVCERN